MRRLSLLTLLLATIFISCGVTLPEYTILEEEVLDAPIKTQVEMRILVSGEITKEGLEALLNKLYAQVKKRKGFEYHKHPTAIYIYAYTSKERAESGYLWIAMLQKNTMNESPSISVNEKQINLLGAEPEEKFGLTEDKRKEIFIEAVKVEDRAMKDAEAKYPLPDPSKPGYSQERFNEQHEKMSELEDQLIEKYKEEVAQKYNLTREQLNAIAVEGSVKDWPLPPLGSK